MFNNLENKNLETNQLISMLSEALENVKEINWNELEPDLVEHYIAEIDWLIMLAKRKIKSQ